MAVRATGSTEEELGDAVADRTSTPGSDGGVVDAAVTETDIDTVALTTAVTDARAGAVVTFCGVVRNHDHGRSVTGIDYVAHPSAQPVLERIATEFVARDGIHALAVRHRVGHLGIGGIALFAAIASSHRQEGFACAADLVDRIKAELPIWKKQFFTDGSHEWSQCP